MVPRMLSCGFSAVAVIVTCGDDVFTLCQLPVHWPSPNGCKEIGESPFENDVTTDPLTWGDVQSSTTLTTNGVGYAAGTLKLLPSEVISGSSCLGVQPVTSCSPAGLVPAGAMTIRIATLRIEKSENTSVIAPRYN